MLHVYVDLVAAGAPAQERYPGLGPLVVRDPFTDQDPGRPYPGVLQSVIHHMLNSHVHKIGDPVAHGTRSQITPSEPFSSCFGFMSLQNEDGLGELACSPGAAV